MSLRKEDFLFRRNLEKEIDLWVKEGIILPDQKERILGRYQLLKTADEKAGPGKLITTVSILGSILVGVGVILFIASNWSVLPNWGRLFIVFSSMLASYGFGFYLRYEAKNYPKVGASLILLGSLIFGAGMFLIAQIYHITVHYPNGPLLWGLFVLPLAYFLRFKSLISLAILVLLSHPDPIGRLSNRRGERVVDWTGLGYVGGPGSCRRRSQPQIHGFGLTRLASIEFGR